MNRVKGNRQCYACGTNNSTQKNGKWQAWLTNRGTPYFLCKQCAEMILHKFRVTASNNKRILFKDQRIHLKQEIRKGICSQCGHIGRTNMHHITYDESNPTAYTIELCVPCHNREHLGTGMFHVTIK